jgi:hypothetical protein
MEVHLGCCGSVGGMPLLDRHPLTVRKAEAATEPYFLAASHVDDFTTSSKAFIANIAMNNSQFRKLVLDTPAHQSSAADSKPTLGATSKRDGVPSALGSRMRSSIPMTPYVSPCHKSKNVLTIDI